MTKFYKKKHFYLLILPMLLFFTTFMVLPILMDVAYSFTDYRAVGTAAWDGMANYQHAFSDNFLGISIRNTLIITAMMLVVIVPISFFIAYTLNRQSGINNMVKTVVFAPYVIPAVLTALIWSFVLNPSSGLINNFLIKIGLETWTQKWINGPTLSPYVFAVVNAWASMGFYVSLWQVGLRSIPADVLEAGLLDGTTKWQQIRHIILPMLGDTVGSILIFVVTAGLKTYEIVYILTGGGPVHKSESIVSYMYTVIFTNMQYGYGMAIAVIECVLALTATLLIRRVMRAARRGA